MSAIRAVRSPEHSMVKPHPPYVIITPARNEASFIEATIRSMVAQTCRPLAWVIVNDGSTDRTEAVVRLHVREHPWIEIVSIPPHPGRDFAGKVGAFNAGLARIRELPYEYVGNLDADVLVSPAHFEFLLARFAEDPQLGLAGTPFSESGVTYDYRFTSTEHVSGACQLFRRQCFESIGGYRPIRDGGVDDVAVLSARLKGWRTRTFVQQTCVHLRPMGTAHCRSRLGASFKLGERAYALGFHPVWQFARSVRQLLRKPYLLGGIALAGGYLWSALRHAERPIGDELVAFQQRDQMNRMRRIVRSLFASRAGRR